MTQIQMPHHAEKTDMTQIQMPHLLGKQGMILILMHLLQEKRDMTLTQMLHLQEERNRTPLPLQKEGNLQISGIIGMGLTQMCHHLEKRDMILTQMPHLLGKRDIILTLMPHHLEKRDMVLTQMPLLLGGRAQIPRRETVVKVGIETVQLQDMLTGTVGKPRRAGGLIQRKLTAVR